MKLDNGGLVCLAIAAACAHPQLRADEYPALKYGAACDSARSAALADPKSTAIVPPSPQKFFMPPVPFPASVRAVNASFMVDELGKPVRGSVQLSGIDDARYSAQFASTILHMQFHPGALNGCAVVAPYRVKVDFPGKR